LTNYEQDLKIEVNIIHNGVTLPIDIKVFAYTFPAICIVMGALLLMYGQQVHGSELTSWGGNLIIIGAALQAFYLFLRFGKKFLED
jgi:hypothetical protein